MRGGITYVATMGCVLMPITARADDLQNRVLQGMHATAPDAYSFQRKMVIERTGTARKVVVERYDPRRPAAERWTLSSVDGKPPSAKDVQQWRKVKRGRTPSYGELAKWFGAPATRASAGPGYMTYRFARLPAGTVKVGSHDASADTQAEALVNVRGKTPFVERVRFTSTKGFSMMMVASVQSMDVSTRYTSLANGSIVPAGSASMIKGSMMGKRGEISTTVSFDSFQPVR